LTLQEKINYFKNLHDVEVNQRYDKNGTNVPYSFHLDMVAAQAHRFKYLILDKHKDPDHPDNLSLWHDVLIACYAHDAIEDARLTYNDIKNRFGERVADMVYACTEFRGRNPEERHPIEFYEYLKQDRLAVFVKLCDVMANAWYSVMSNNNNMGLKAKKRFNEKFKNHCYLSEFYDMYSALDVIYTFIQ
jgi:(p)ppGpp synthase/HD superfamily hydrolase